MAVEKENFFDEFQALIWVQPGGANPANALFPLFCHDVDGIDETFGDVSRRYCRQGDGRFKVIHTTRGTPSATTFDVETWYGKTASWLDDQVAQGCGMPFYFHSTLCGRQDVSLNYDRGKLLINAIVLSRASSNMVKTRADEGDSAEMSGRTYSLNADSNSPEYWKLAETRIDLLDVAATQDISLRDIYMDSDWQCADNCGTEKPIGTTGAMVGDNIGAAVAFTWFTDDKWAAGDQDQQAGAFAVSEANASVVRFPISATEFRTLMVCGTDGAAGLRVAYSDDEGATWTVVVINLIATESGAHGGALFAFDKTHIWLGTDLAGIFFSDDGGVTWTAQTVPTPGANGILCVDFYDENNGLAVGGATGASEWKLITSDGGLHWAQISGVAQAAVMATGCVMITPQHLQTVWEDGDLWYSLDAGATWAQKALPVTLTKAGDIHYLPDGHNGAIVGYTSGDFAVMLRTFTGGSEWESFTYGTTFDAIVHYGLNSVVMVDQNTIYSAGDLVGTEALFLTWQRYG